ncbi:MAG: glycoside hydrolase family 13 protein [Clostridiales bacterium]|jgi:glycosidase|nr:glycoside hydrolase family 13 protein [Clostridiales bacterium]
MNPDLSRSIEHRPDSRYCFAQDGTLILRLRTAKNAPVVKITVIYGCKYDFTKRRKETLMYKAFSDRLFDYYTATLVLDDARLVYIFAVELPEGRYYYSEEGIGEGYDFATAYMTSFQMPFINPCDIHVVPEWYRSAAFYSIFPERFRNGGGSRKDYVNLPWGAVPGSKSYAGGDILGIVQSLDYIKDLGFNALYLTPVFTSPTNHKYEITDYYNIDPAFGTNGDFKELVQKCHALGMRIVLDAVFNHCGIGFPFFRDVMEKGRESAYYGWFIIDGERPDPKLGNYAFFGLSNPEMPKLNMANPEAREYFLDVAEHWISKYGIDGWRLDVSDEVPHDFWRDFRKAVKRANPEAVILGENWHDAVTCLGGDQFDGIMNYAFSRACADYFAGGTLDEQGLSERLSGLLMRNTGPANAMMLNLLDSHDTDRFLTTLNGNADKLRAALALAFLFPGAPCVYYGTEIDMEGGYDPDNRRTMDWEKAGERQETAEVIRALAKLRRKKAVMYGDVRFRAGGGAFVMERFYQDEAVTLRIEQGEYTLKER